LEERGATGISDAYVPLIVESAQVFETHHVAMRLAAGREALLCRISLKEFAEAEEPGAFKKVRSGMYNGLRKVLARMGISNARHVSQQPFI